MAEVVARISRWLIPAILIFTIVALAGWWYTGRVEVTLHVDGRTVALATRASTVGELLSARDIELGAHDRVVPASRTELADGADIRVVRARPVALDLNGALRTVWTTGTTVNDVLREVGLDADVVAPSRSARVARGETLVLRDVSQVTVAHDGQEASLVSSALTVGELLANLGVTLDADDEVSPALDDHLQNGTRVEIVRVANVQSVEERQIAFRTERRNDPTISQGETRVVQAGRNGLERITSAVVRRNGAVASKKVVSREVVRQPVTQIVAVGTKPVNRQSGQASWYETTSMTCAHRTLPKGTMVTVTNVSTGRSVTCRVNDRGPYVSGRIIDLAHDAFAQIASRSQGVVEVVISW